jgi:hypothetical protein
MSGFISNIPGIFSAAEGEARSKNLPSRRRGKGGGVLPPPPPPLPLKPANVLPFMPPAPTGAIANMGFIRPPTLPSAAPAAALGGRPVTGSSHVPAYSSIDPRRGAETRPPHEGRAGGRRSPSSRDSRSVPRGRRKRSRSSSSRRSSSGGYKSSTSARLQRVARQQRPRDSPPRRAAHYARDGGGAGTARLSTQSLQAIAEDKRIPEWLQASRSSNPNARGTGNTASHTHPHQPIPAPASNQLQLKQRVSRLILEECTAKVTNNTIQSFQALCTTLCDGPADVLIVLGVLEDELAQLTATRRYQQTLRIWYLVDSLLKLFRKHTSTKPLLLDTALEQLPRMVERYVPFQHRMQDPDLLDKFSDMFKTWRNFAPHTLFVTIANLELEV